jgi:hypothetical protein
MWISRLRSSWRKGMRRLLQARPSVGFYLNRFRYVEGFQ